MSRPISRIVAVTLLAAGALGACSTPDPNPPAKFSGDPTRANPSLATTTAVPPTSGPPTTRFWAQTTVPATTEAPETTEAPVTTTTASTRRGPTTTAER